MKGYPDPGSGAPALSVGAAPADPVHGRTGRWNKQWGTSMHKVRYTLAAIATILAAGAALGGLLIAGLYVDAPNWVQQARGTDLATLFLAVPVLAVGLWSVAHGSVRGRLAVTAGLLYLVYNYAIFAFSVAMNPLTIVHIAIFGLSLWSLVLPGPVAPHAREVTDRLDRNTAGAVLTIVAALFGLLWVGQIAAATATGVLPSDLIKAGISTNPVYALDLGFFLPLCAIAGIGLIRGTSAAELAFPMLIWVALMGAGVVGGFLVMATAGETIPVAIVTVISLIIIVSSILAARAVVRSDTVHSVAPAVRRARQLRA
jgi:hypothetical protein